MSLHSLAVSQSVALFAITPPEVANAPNVTETPLWNVCAFTGGLLLPVHRPRDLPQSIDTLLDLLRSRYILEFPRANNLASGQHVIDVEVPQSRHALVRVTGLSVPMLDEKLRNDPSTVPYLEADRPLAGHRRPLLPSSPQP